MTTSIANYPVSTLSLISNFKWLIAHVYWPIIGPLFDFYLCTVLATGQCDSCDRFREGEARLVRFDSCPCVMCDEEEPLSLSFYCLAWDGRGESPMTELALADFAKKGIFPRGRTSTTTTTITTTSTTTSTTTTTTTVKGKKYLFYMKNSHVFF